MNRKVSLLGLFAVLSLQTAPGYTAASESQQQLADRLRHEYGLVKSMRCSYDTVYSPTTPEMIELVRQLRQTSKYARSFSVEQLIYSQAEAEAHSSRRTWWRKGPREREDKYSVTDDAKTASPSLSSAFDGQLYREVSRDSKSGKVRASVHTVASSHWGQAVRSTPFDWLYLYADTPYADIVAKATKFEGVSVKVSGRALTQYTIHSPKLGDRTLVLFFDDTGLLVERHFNCSPMPGEPEDVCEQNLFSDYQPVADSSGETIWFPRRVDYHSYLGRLPDGRLVDNFPMQMRVIDLKINEEIPSQFFELEIPQNARVWDGVNGMGWLEEGASLPTYQPPGATYWRLIIVAVVVFLVVVSIAWVAWRRRRKTSS